MFIALDLLALGFGYKVFAEATKEKKGLKEGGRIIGIIIVILATAAIINGVLMKSMQCSRGNRGGGCPIMSKMCLVAPKK